MKGALVAVAFLLVGCCPLAGGRLRDVGDDDDGDAATVVEDEETAAGRPDTAAQAEALLK